MRLLANSIAVLFLIILAGCPQPSPTVSPVVLPPTTEPTFPVTEVPALPAPPQPISMTNSGLNLPYTYQDPTQMTIYVPQGWKVGWLNPPPCQPGHEGCFIGCPAGCKLPNGNCSNDYGCSWAQPETTRALSVEYEGLRVLEGDASAKSFVYGRQGEWWYYQTITTPVTFTVPVTFSAYLQAWQCFDYANCSKGKRSDKPTAMHLKVGIDPTGGTVVTSTNVVWSAEGDAHRINKDSPDIWHNFSVTASVHSKKITVFVSTFVDWSSPALDFPELYDGNYSRPNNELYVDNASLETAYWKAHLPVVTR